MSSARVPVTIVDYGLGNLHSVANALAFVGGRPEVTGDLEKVAASTHVVLPGVGAFGDGMQNLRERGLVDALRAHAAAGKPLLGICLGMQLLFSRSEEFGSHDGLDILPGEVLAIPHDLGVKVPHVGWNRVALPPGRSWGSTVLAGVEPGSWMYFVHSFSARPTAPELVLGVTPYGGHPITAVAARGLVTGCQFHPEKSGPQGLSILERFLRQS